MKNYIDDAKDIFVFSISSMTIIGLFLLLLIVNVDFWVAFLISMAVGGILFYKQKDMPAGRKMKKIRLKSLTPEKEAFYKSQGLEKEETTFFRETMQTAKLQITEIEKNFSSVTKLKAIEHRHNVVRISKALFQEITHEPNRLHEVDKFLYVHLPSLMDLTGKYVEIDRHEAKSKATYDILEKSAETVNELSKLIVEDYVIFKSEDLNDMEVEVELAKRTIERDNGFNSSIEQEEI